MNLIVYGSLINKKELENETISLFDVELVRVEGFRRVFNQEPSYRLLESQNRAVLNIQEDVSSYFNAIVIKNLTLEYFEVLDKREKGYNRVLLESRQVKLFDGTIFEDSYVYVGKEEKRSNIIFPNENYLDICLEGVQSFGNEFFNEFRKTTYKNSHKGLVLI